jgi:PAS domain S-box-containing protein
MAGSRRPRTAPQEPAAAVVGAEGVVTAWSAGARDLLGYEPVAAVGRKAADLLAEPLPAAARHRWEQHAAWSGPVVARHCDGRGLRVRLEARPLLNADGRTCWYLTAEEPEAGARDADEPDLPLLEQWSVRQAPLPMSLFDRRGLRRAVNTAMEALLGRPERELIGLRVGEYAPGRHLDGLEGVGESMERVLRTGEPVAFETELSTPGEREHAWLVSLSPVQDPSGRVWGVCMAATDTTEQSRARKRLGLLDEAGLRIGTTLDVARTADELAEVGTEHVADFVAVDLLEGVAGGGEAVAAHRADMLPFRRTAQRSVLPGCPEALVPLGGLHTHHRHSPAGYALAAGRAVVTPADEAALDAWAMGSPERARAIRAHGIHSLLSVPLQARGTTLGVAVFCRHRTPVPFDEDDVRLAEGLAARAAVCVDNARRYTRERTTALALQRSLLPDHVPSLAAVDVAARYLPADPGTGIGGDWFDVIPLSGARVALVVGDVAGHGIQACATMGRLCTAVRTLADVDLAPDELLTQLDDLVLRMDQAAADGGDAGESAAEVGATCLYAVYDPISRACTMARAGHPAPLLATPDGRVEVLDVPGGPPLGLGGLPFEVGRFDLPEGSMLAFYTNGLLEGTDPGADDARTALRAALAAPGRPPEAVCDGMLRGLLPGHRTDDAALLLARTRALDAGRVATWELPAESAVVARARELVAGTLSTWLLDEVSFVAELVASELVTNAIRYGRPPVHLRLIRDVPASGSPSGALICEVADASSTAPHLRRARVYDEGGRGLLIVAQLAGRWGTRHTRTGKTIWAELPLPAALPAAGTR